MNIINTKIAEYIHLRKLFSKKRNKPRHALSLQTRSVGVPKGKAIFVTFNDFIVSNILSGQCKFHLQDGDKHIRLLPLISS